MALLIGDGEAALGLLIRVGEIAQLLDRLVLRIDLQEEVDVRLGVLVSGEDARVVRERSEGLVERGVHLLGAAFEEFAAAADEEGVPGEHGAFRWRFRPVFHVVADAVLGVAGRVERGDGDVLAEREARVVRRRLRHAVAVFAADDCG